MRALVTSKGRVTIPKELREKFGIEAGTQVDFVTTAGGILLRKAVECGKGTGAFGCLKSELAGRSVEDILDELRGPMELPRIGGNGPAK